MELVDVYYNRDEYIETASGNKVCRKSVLCGSQNIMLQGRTIIQSQCMIRGDLASVKIGRYCVISSKAVVRPPFKKFSNGVACIPMSIGDHVFIGENSIINAAAIGSYVYIGANVVIGKHCVLKDCCFIADNSVLPQGTIVAAFAVFAGSPASFVEELPECTQDLMIDHTKLYYEHFKPKQMV